MSKRGQTDWAAVQFAFVSSMKSYRAVAAQFGLAYSTVYRKATAEGWGAQRQKYQGILLSACAGAESRYIAEGISLCLRAAETILEALSGLLEKEVDIPVRDYRSLTGALKDILDIFQTDLDSKKKQADIELARRRLGEGEDRTVRIVISGGDDYAQ